MHCAEWRFCKSSQLRTFPFISRARPLWQRVGNWRIKAKDTICRRAEPLFHFSHFCKEEAPKSARLPLERIRGSRESELRRGKESATRVMYERVRAEKTPLPCAKTLYIVRLAYECGLDNGTAAAQLEQWALSNTPTLTRCNTFPICARKQQLPHL